MAHSGVEHNRAKSQLNNGNNKIWFRNFRKNQTQKRKKKKETIFQNELTRNSKKRHILLVTRRKSRKEPVKKAFYRICVMQYAKTIQTQIKISGESF